MRLALAFGSRGKGRALAHYEPGRHVINLTKMSGAGCLAHEWGHALDRYLAIKCGVRGLYLSVGKRHDDMAHTLIYNKMLELVDTMCYIPSDCIEECCDAVVRDIRVELDSVLIDLNHLIHRLRSRDEKIELEIDRLRGSGEHGEYKIKSLEATKSKLGKVYEAVNSIALLVKDTTKYNKEDVEGMISTVKSVLDTDIDTEVGDLIGVKSLRRKIVSCSNIVHRAVSRVVYLTETIRSGNSTIRYKTNYYSNALEFDSQKSKPYYSTNVEMFARAFEAYINDVLDNKGVTSQYLVHSTNTKLTMHGLIYSTYPLDKERERLDRKFSEFIGVVKSELGLGDNPLKEIYADVDKFERYSSDKKDMHKKILDSIEAEKAKSAKGVNGAAKKVVSTHNSGVDTGSVKVQVNTADMELKEALTTFYGNNTKRNGIDNNLVSEMISKFIVMAKDKLKFADVGLMRFRDKHIVGLGKSKAYNILNKQGAVYLIVDGDCKREKQLEAVIEAVVSVVVKESYGATPAGDMIAEGCTYSICKGIGLDVRTYCLSDDFSALSSNKRQKISYINICKKVCNTIIKL